MRLVNGVSSRAIGALVSFFDRFRDVPDWAKPLSRPEYLRFSSIVSAALTERGFPSSIRSGMVAAQVNGEKATFVFKTLARKCSTTPQERWEALVKEHFDRSVQEQQLVVEVETNFERALPYLRVQLVTDGYLHRTAVEGVSYRRYADELVETLVFDLPNIVQSVSPTAIEKWNQPLETVWARALEQTKAGAKSFTIESEQTESQVSLHRLTDDDSFFVATQVLWLDQWPEGRHESGLLVSLPSRHVVQFTQFGVNALAAMELLALSGIALHEQLPGALTPSLYWVRAGSAVRIPVTRNASGQVQILPSSEVMAAIPKAG